MFFYVYIPALVNPSAFLSKVYSINEDLIDCSWNGDQCFSGHVKSIHFKFTAIFL